MTGQIRLDKCRVCGGWLPKRKASFCSDYCQNRFHSWRKPPSPWFAFAKTVVEPIPVANEPEAQRKAQLLIDAGAVRGYSKEGIIHAIGVPWQRAHALDMPPWMRKVALERDAKLAAARKEEFARKREAERAARRSRGRHIFSKDEALAVAPEVLSGKELRKFVAKIEKGERPNEELEARVVARLKG